MMMMNGTERNSIALCQEPYLTEGWETIISGEEAKNVNRSKILVLGGGEMAPQRKSEGS
jgi:hypothetical protein